MQRRSRWRAAATAVLELPALAVSVVQNPKDSSSTGMAGIRPNYRETDSTRSADVFFFSFFFSSSGGWGKIKLDLFRAPKSLPILTSSTFVKKGFPVVQALSSPHFHIFSYTSCRFNSIAFATQR